MRVHQVRINSVFGMIPVNESHIEAVIWIGKLLIGCGRWRCYNCCLVLEKFCVLRCQPWVGVYHEQVTWAYFIAAVHERLGDNFSRPAFEASDFEYAIWAPSQNRRVKYQRFL